MIEVSRCIEAASSLKNAGHLWAKETGETERVLRGKLGDEKIQVSMIGPGGENMVRFAMKFFKNGVKDDAMPDRYFEPFVSGRLRRVAHDRDNFQRAKEIYYQLAGWDRKT